MRTRLPLVAAGVVLLVVAAVPEPVPQPAPGPLSLCGAGCESSIAFEDGPGSTSPPSVVTAPLPVDLATAQWRKVREPFDFDPDDAADFEPGARKRLAGLAAALRPDSSGRLELTGAQWATVTYQLADWTQIVAFANDEAEPESRIDPSAYWKIVDRISAQLGGPRHPKLGLR